MGWSTVIVGVAGVSLATERMVAIARARRGVGAMTDLVIHALRTTGEVDGVIGLCAANPGPVARVIRAALSSVTRPVSEVEEAIRAALKLEQARLRPATLWFGVVGISCITIGVVATITDLAPSPGVAPNAAIAWLKGLSESAWSAVLGAALAAVSYIGHTLVRDHSKRANAELAASAERLTSAFVELHGKVSLAGVRAVASRPSYRVG